MMKQLFLFVFCAMFVCTVSSFDECLPENHQLFDEDWRHHEYSPSKVIKDDDSDLKTGWFRFNGSSFRMLERNELLPNVTMKNMVTFQPCGIQQFFTLDVSANIFYTRTTPLYVLDGKHPDIKGALMNAKVIGCHYRSAQEFFGLIPKDAEAKCESPTSFICKFEQICLEEYSIDVIVRNCGEFFVYHLKPVHKLIPNFFSMTPKSGVYCGSESKEMPKPSSPCLCKLTNKEKQLVKTTLCNIGYKGKDRKTKFDIYMCLFNESSPLYDVNEHFDQCYRNLTREEGNNKSKYDAKEIKKRQQECFDVNRQVRAAIREKWSHLMNFKN